jgi:Transposase domain (DUF772)
LALARNLSALERTCKPSAFPSTYIGLSAVGCVCHESGGRKEILKHTFNVSDEVLCELWLENPYYQYLCGKVVAIGPTPKSATA